MKMKSIKKILLNRVNSLPSFKTKKNIYNEKHIPRQQSNRLILIQKNILKKNNFNNINRSTQNIHSLRLKSVIERKPKNRINNIKLINPFISLENNNNNNNSSIVLPEMNIYKSSYLQTCLKTISENKKNNTNTLSDDELVLLLKAKCHDIGIEFRENMFLKFKEYCLNKCKNRIADFSQFNIGLNYIRMISILLLNTNRLSRLDLSKNNIGNKGVEILVKSIKDSKALVSLNIASNSITHKGGELIFYYFIYQQSLVDINLASLEGSNRNRITELGVQYITTFLNKNHFIENLNLSGNSIKNEGFFLICKGLETNQSLINLDISSNSITEKGLKQGLDFISNHKIYSKINILNISNNFLSNTGVILLTNNLRYFPNLISLNISYCGLEFKGFQRLLKIVQFMKRLETLNVSGNKLKNDTYYILKECFTVFSIKYLNMSRCLLGDRSTFYLGECISSNESLKYLNISGNGITDAGFGGFSNIFKFNKNIEIFDCSCNFITNLTCRNFVRSLENNTSLKSINLYDNQLNDEIGGDFINAIKNNSHLIYINLSYNRIQSKTIEDINKKLKINIEKQKNNIIPDLIKNIKELEFRPEQFESLSRIITEKQKMLKISHKKLKEEDKNFRIIIDKMNKKFEIENTKLQNLLKKKKKFENELNIINKVGERSDMNRKKECEKIKEKIEKEKMLINQLSNENESLLKNYEIKKKESNDKIIKKQKKLKLSLDRYNLSKNEYDIKEKEYIKKYKYYEDLINPSLLIKTEIKENNNNNTQLNDNNKNKNIKLKLNLNPKKIPLNSNVYSNTTISTGNTGQNLNLNTDNKSKVKTFKFNNKQKTNNE